MFLLNERKKKIIQAKSDMFSVYPFKFVNTKILSYGKGLTAFYLVACKYIRFRLL